MLADPLEPGILLVFRLFLGLQLLLGVFGLHAHTAHGVHQAGSPAAALVLLLGGIGGLLAGLSWRSLRRRLGRAFLSLALACSATLTLVLQDCFLDIRFSWAGGYSEEAAWQVFLFLFVPVVLAAWQHGARGVLALVGLTALLDFGLMWLVRPDFPAIFHACAGMITVRSLAFAVVGLVVAHIMRQLRQERRELQRANHELARFAGTLEELATSRERSRLARELHDTLAHTLSGLAVQLEAAGALLERDQARAAALIEQSLQTTRDGLTETRAAIRALRASPLDELGLAGALRERAREAARRTGARLEARLPAAAEQLPPLPTEVEQCVYRVGQEALENVARHARPTCIGVTLCSEGDTLRLRIEDDGAGFDPAAVPGEGHLGLQGMRERAEAVGARLEVRSAPGRGTSVCLTW